MDIFDYIKWRGDLSFKQDPFNIVDAIIFSNMSYINFDKEFIDKDVISICDLDKNKKINNKRNHLDITKTKGLLHLMANTKRYKDIKIYNYISKLHKESSEQFSALMLDLPNRQTLVCFRGTDDSLIGWKEDLMLSYTETKSQIDAVEYLNNNCKKLRRYIICGHSKGGNLALHASVNAKTLVRFKISKIYSFDGPGLRKGSYDERIYAKLNRKYIKIIPENDLVGTIFDDDCQKIVVKSSERFVMQHEMWSWQIIANKLDTTTSASKLSKTIKQGFKDFLDNTTINQRKIFVDSLFDNLALANINNLSDFESGGFEMIFKALKSLSKLDPNAKITADKLIKSFTDLFDKEISRLVENKVKKIIKIKK